MQIEIMVMLKFHTWAWKVGRERKRRERSKKDQILGKNLTQE